jgi:hypothetical protein
MTFPEFFVQHYRPEPGCAVALADVICDFYSDPRAAFDSPPDAILRYLESRYPVGNLNRQTCVGNIRGPRGTIQGERPFVLEFGQLLPADRRPHEYLPGHDSRFHTLSGNEMRVRGWNQIYRSRAERMAQQKSEY